MMLLANRAWVTIRRNVKYFVSLFCIVATTVVLVQPYLYQDIVYLVDIPDRGQNRTLAINREFIFANKGDDSVRFINKESTSPLYCTGRTIAMGIAVSFRGKLFLLRRNGVRMSDSPFFQDMLPSFMDTASGRYCYRFYVAYDYNDPVLASPTGRDAFIACFTEIMELWMPMSEVNLVDLHFVRCNHTHKPAWAQNDAMMAAYAQNASYYYMVNDDTKFVTSHWGQLFARALQNMQPPNLGIVGPNHIGGNLKVLTYNFVHKTHIDIFGYFYPNDFYDWGADEWITMIYRPDNSKKLDNVVVDHLMNMGTRYRHSTNYDLEASVAKSKQKLKKYLT